LVCAWWLDDHDEQIPNHRSCRRASPPTPADPQPRRSRATRHQRVQDVETEFFGGEADAVTPVLQRLVAVKNPMAAE
jgi:hypothetical protein